MLLFVEGRGGGPFRECHRDDRFFVVGVGGSGVFNFINLISLLVNPFPLGSYFSVLTQ